MNKSFLGIAILVSAILMCGSCNRISSKTDTKFSENNESLGGEKDIPKQNNTTGSTSESPTGAISRVSKEWWVHEIQNDRSKLISDISSGIYSDRELVEIISLNRDKAFLDLEIAPVAMEAWLKRWNPVGKTKDDLIKQLGPPDFAHQNLIYYEFMLNGGAGYVFTIENGTIASWKRGDRQ
jgi:hypothetical protein